MSATVKTELDKIQTRLHDQAVLWTRAELLRWFNDGYRRLVAESEAVRRFFVFNVPPRSAGSGTYDWEQRHAGGTFRKFAKTALGGAVVCSYQWEVEALEGISPTAANPCFTQLWELQYVGGNVDDHFQYFLTKAHERVLRLAWDDKAMSGTSGVELDQKGSRWWQEPGEPLWWLRGMGRDKTFETFQIPSTYSQSYMIAGTELGCPRFYSGSRTYGQTSIVYKNDYAYTSDADIAPQQQKINTPAEGALAVDSAPHGLGWRFSTHESTTEFDCMYGWEVQHLQGATTFTDSATVFSYWWEAEVLGVVEVTFAIGATRAITSPNRQYLPMAYDTGELQQFGTVREFQSSKDTISIWETIVHTRELEEDDAPALVPSKLYKYIRFYVWAIAFGREGEGMRPDLSTHYLARFAEGIALLKRFGVLTNRDRNYAREDMPGLQRQAPGRPRLPATYPRLEY